MTAPTVRKHPGKVAQPPKQWQLDMVRRANCGEDRLKLVLEYDTTESMFYKTYQRVTGNLWSAVHPRAGR